jgi:hypothetical protein
MKSKEYVLDINIKKNKILIINKENSHNLPVSINVYEKDLEVVKNFSFLEHIITIGEKCEKEINKRTGMAKNILTKMKHIHQNNCQTNKN